MIGGHGGRVGLLVLRKLICSGYEGVKRHDGLQWALVNVLVFWGNGLFKANLTQTPDHQQFIQSCNSHKQKPEIYRTNFFFACKPLYTNQAPATLTHQIQQSIHSLLQHTTRQPSINQTFNLHTATKLTTNRCGCVVGRDPR